MTQASTTSVADAMGKIKKSGHYEFSDIIAKQLGSSMSVKFCGTLLTLGQQPILATLLVMVSQ